MQLSFPDVFNKFIVITQQQDEKSGAVDQIIALKDRENRDQVC